ncbi:MAG: short-chain dehydrogenase [Ramlibacter sp.]|jgi:uncharacterized protein involved in response to NO|nr:short-chain dehydrogenase [Ramlibacter sp.]
MQIIDTTRELAIPPLFRLGFRPFFLGGALFALVAVPLWLLAWNGHFAAWQPAGGWLAWHRHEMLFGFGAAIVAGFLLTAVQNWTERPGLRGAPLAALATLWLAARIAWLADAPAALLVPLQLAFLPLVALVMARMLFAVRQARNYPVVVVLLLMTLADALNMAGVVQGDVALQQRGAMTGIWVIVTLLGLIGGRVIPFFTMRGLGLKKGPVALPWMDWVVLVGGMAMVLLTAAGIARDPHAAIAVFCFQLAAGHLLRLCKWYEPGIWRVPLLWSLHLAYAWLVVATFGFGLWHAGFVANLSLPLHALTIGAMSGAILAMIARVSLGHTGRELLPPRAMTPAFVLLNLGMLARTLLVIAWPQTGLVLAALCWTLAFAIFSRHYAPMLWSARVDGRPG